jgi:hypothetical protein
LAIFVATGACEPGQISALKSLGLQTSELLSYYNDKQFTLGILIYPKIVQVDCQVREADWKE